MAYEYYNMSDEQIDWAKRHKQCRFCIESKVTYTTPCGIDDIYCTLKQKDITGKGAVRAKFCRYYKVERFKDMED